MREVAAVVSSPELAGSSSGTDSGTDSGTGGEATWLWRCLTALSEAAAEQERQQEQEFGMVLEPRAQQLAAALGCVRSILGNITLHPDDEKLRRIRINHPAIKEKLTKFGVPAVRLLVAVGFHARAVMAQGSPIPDEDEVEGVDSQERNEAKGEQQQVQEVEMKGKDSEWLRAEVDRALAADGTKSTSRLTLLLIMPEPPTETAAGREAWKIWFDGLQTSADKIQIFESSQ
mmetsp:Transcript_20482/g.38049  ORF Transcript_20482/g.38049 Transcript_20482/m.38049 type:complete len:231 (-) Transcript_20482:212-904(-)